MQLHNIIKQALKEDIGKGDITTNAIVPKAMTARAVIVAKDEGIIAGLDIARQVFKELDRKILFRKKINDGHAARKFQVIAEIKGNAQAILAGERVALNFLQRLSGIATLTAEFMKSANSAGNRKGKNVKILDTRKTTPLLRELEKYAVKAGGGNNHRFGLYDAVLIKDNHIAIAESITEAVRRARKINKNIEVEAKSLKEVKEALNLNAKRIMLDNMRLNDIKKAVKLVRLSGKNVETEVSGGINLNNIKAIAKTGIDYISIGALTHSAKALDISMEVYRI